MLPETHPLIEAATKPLADNAEQRLAANAMLEETFDATHPGIPQALTRLQQIDSRKHPGIWKWVLPVLAGISLIAVGFVLIPKVRSILILYSYFHSSLIDAPEETLRSDLTAEQNLLLGDPKKTPLQQSQDLMESDTNRPDFYADFVAQYLSHFNMLPPDYFDTVARIDPDNAFFLYLAAAVSGKGSVETIKRTPLQRKNNELMQFTILDETRLLEAMVLFHKARKLPRFETYGIPLLSERIRLLKQDDIYELAPALGYVAGQTSICIRLSDLSNMISAQSARLAKNKDAAAFETLLADNEHFLKTWATSSSGFFVDELVFWVAVAGTTAATYDAASQLGLENEVARLEERKAAVDERIEWKHRKIPNDPKDIFPIKGGMLPNYIIAPMTGRQIRNPIPILEKDLTPGRLMDHDIASQFFLALVLITLILAFEAVSLFRFRSPSPGRKIARRMEQLLDKTDWLWILAVGIIFPFIYVILINRFTPLGGREYNLEYFGSLLPYMHYGLMALCILFAPVLLIRWRLGKRMEPFSPALRKSRIAWVVLFFSLSYVPCVYILAKFTGGDMQQPLIFQLPPFLLGVTIIITAARALFGKRERRIARAATAGALIPAYSLAIILLAALYPLLNASEGHWFAKDTLMKLDPKNPGMTAYEYKIGVQLRKETIAILEP